MRTAKTPRANQKTTSDNVISITRLDGDKDATERCNDEYKYLFDNTSDAIRVINSDFTIRRINQAFADMTGVDKDDVTGRKCWEVFPSPHCHTQECRLQRILNGENQIQVEIERQKKNRAIISCVVTTSRLVDKANKLTGIIEQFRDVTERRHLEEHVKESEELYKDLFQNVPVAIMEYDFSDVKQYYDQLRYRGVKDFRNLFFDVAPDELLNCEERLRLTRINRKAKEESGISSTEEHLLQMIIRHKEHRGEDEGPRECHIGLAEGKTYFDYEQFGQDENGNLSFSHHVWVSVAPGCEDSLSKVYVCLVDMTERKKAEKELLEYKKHLEEVIEQRTSELHKSRQIVQELFQAEHYIREKLEAQLDKRVLFSRAIVHELKTPLTPMLVASEILSRIQDEKLKPIAQNLHEGAVALDKRIDELMDISRGEIGTLQVKMKKCDVVNLIKSVVEETLCLFHDRNQTLALTTKRASLIVNIDPERIRQVLVNLLDNASKFTPQGGHIKISVREQNDHLLVEIEDNGMGIPDTEKTKIFEPYYSLRDSKQSRAGIGLGLALAKMIIELHGGEIKVRNAKVHGSIFYFSLPIRDNA